MTALFAATWKSGNGPELTSGDVRYLVAIGREAEVTRFSPFELQAALDSADARDG